MSQQRPGRIVVIDSVVYQGNGVDEKAVSVPVRFARNLQTEEQPYFRRMNLGKEWKPLERGWIEKCGMMVLENKEKHGRAGDDAKIVEVSFHHSLSTDFIVLPEESMRGVPCNLKSVYVRCVGGEATLAVSLYPE